MMTTNCHINATEHEAGAHGPGLDTLIAI